MAGKHPPCILRLGAVVILPAGAANAPTAHRHNEDTVPLKHVQEDAIE